MNDAKGSVLVDVVPNIIHRSRDRVLDPFGRQYERRFIFSHQRPYVSADRIVPAIAHTHPDEFVHLFGD